MSELAHFPRYGLYEFIQSWRRRCLPQQHRWYQITLPMQQVFWCNVTCLNYDISSQYITCSSFAIKSVSLLLLLYPQICPVPRAAHLRSLLGHPL